MNNLQRLHHYNYSRNTQTEGTIFFRVECTLFYIENDSEIFPAHYAWKVAKRGFKMAFMMNKLAINNSCYIFLEK